RPAENSPRVQPSSAVTGSMKTLVTKMTAGPGPTTLPMSEPQTIHHRFAKTPARGAALVLAIKSPSFCAAFMSARMRGAWHRGRPSRRSDDDAFRPLSRFGGGACGFLQLVFARAPHAGVIGFERELPRPVGRFLVRHDVLHAARIFVGDFVRSFEIDHHRRRDRMPSRPM